MHGRAALDPTLIAALSVTVETCRHALADYRAGLIDDGELADEVMAGGHLDRLRDVLDGLSAGGGS